MTNLNTANIGMNKYCGPTVLSILTGKSTDECASVIGRISGQYKVEGVELSHLLKAADRLGFDNKVIPVAGNLFVTLCRLSTNGDGMYIVAVPNHYVVIEVNEKRIYFCDNHTKEPIPAAASARLLQKVMAINQVFKRPDVVIIPSPKIEPKPEPEVRPDDGLFEVFGCYTCGNKLIAVFRSEIDADDYAFNNGLMRPLPIRDDKLKWYVP